VRGGPGTRGAPGPSWGRGSAGWETGDGGTDGSCVAAASAASGADVVPVAAAPSGSAAQASTIGVPIANSRNRLLAVRTHLVDDGMAEHLSFEHRPVLEGVSRSDIARTRNRELHVEERPFDGGGNDPLVAEAPLHLRDDSINAFRIL